MNLKKVAALFYLLILAFTINASEVELLSSIDKARLTTGDVAIFKITLKKKKDIILEIPDVGPKITGFRIIEFFNEKERELSDEKVELVSVYKLQADLVGTYILPAIELKYLNNKNEETSIKTNEIFVEVVSVLKEGDENSDIKDIYPLFSLPYSLTIWGYVFVSCLFLLIVGFLFYRFYKKRKQNKEIKTNIPPDQVARSHLEHLIKMQYLDKAQYKLFCYELSEIIRNYFEDSYAVALTDMTYEEIKKELVKRQEIAEEIKDQLLLILKECDVIKFTDTILSKERGSDLISLVEKIIKETSPKNQEEEEESVV